MPHSNHGGAEKPKTNEKHSTYNALHRTRKISNKRREKSKNDWKNYVSNPENKEKERKRAQTNRASMKNQLIILDERVRYLEKDRDYWKMRFIRWRDQMISNEEVEDLMSNTPVWRKTKRKMVTGSKLLKSK